MKNMSLQVKVLIISTIIVITLFAIMIKLYGFRAW